MTPTSPFPRSTGRPRCRQSVARTAVFAVFLLSIPFCSAAAAESPSAERSPTIADLLRRYCIGCHNNVDREGGVSLLSRAAIQEGSDSGPLLSPDEPNSSRLLRVLHPDADVSMPPDGEPQPSPEERRRLQQWVLEGAPLDAAVARPQVPAIPARQVTRPILASAVLPSGDILLAGPNRITRLQPESRQERWTVTEPLGKITRLVLSADGRLVGAACGTPGLEGAAVLIRTQDGRIVRRFPGHTDAVYAVALNVSANLLASAGYDRSIRLFDLSSGRLLRKLAGHNGTIFDLDFDPAGQVLCSASADGTVKVWQTSTGQRLDTLSQPQAEQFCVRVSPSGQSVYAAGADSRIREWTLVSREDVRINPLMQSTFAHERPVTILEFSADGRRLASAAEDGTVRVWTVRPFRPLQSLPRQKSLVTSIRFFDDDRLLLTRLDGSWNLVPLPAPDRSDTDITQNGPSPPAATAGIGSRVPAEDAEPAEITEQESNDTADTAQTVPFPVRIQGVIDGGDRSDQDCFAFEAQAGQQIRLEVMAAKNGSPLDSVVDVLDDQGRPVLRTRLQAVRNSWFTFRGKDSDTSDDFRVFYWQEMELNDLLYADGEVVRLWHYPRGPDSGFRVYPGFGKRHTVFDTTPVAHALQAPCYIVVPRAPEEPIVPGGLPVFPVYYRNDDDGSRAAGRDSRLMFTAPTDGTWIARVTDARGFQGPEFRYELRIRRPRPDFRMVHNGRRLTIPRTGGREIRFTLRRIDDFSGPVSITAVGLPPGIHLSDDLTIEPGQFRAYGVMYCDPDAPQPTPEQTAAVRLRATATIDGRPVTRDLTPIDSIELLDNPPLTVHIGTKDGRITTARQPLELTIRPGQTIRAVIRLERHDADGVVSFGKDDSGRNLPHGVFVDNIGLNGLLLPAGALEREFFITAAPIVRPARRTFFLKSSVNDITSLPVVLHVLPEQTPARESPAERPAAPGT